MINLLQNFRAFVKREKLFAKSDRLLLACSGGVDSTVLAHLLHAEGYDFAIAHVNFQLRGKASDGDAVFVEQLARALGAKFFGTTVDVKKDAEKIRYGESTQMAARRIRYRYFRKISDEYNYSHILTAHHADDGLETVLLGLIRGSNYHGLLPLTPTNERVRHPLLETTREMLADYAREEGISWREDESNAEDTYLRNKVRHRLLPVLEKEFGLKPENWRKLQRQMWLDRELIQLAERELAGKHSQIKNSETLVRRENLEHEAALLRRIAPTRGFTPEQIRQMSAVTENTTLYSRRWRVEITPDQFRFILGEESLPAPVNITRVEQLPFVSDRVQLHLQPRPADLNDGVALYLAPCALPLHLRPRQNGDRFQPFGMGGKHKKLQDYFVDQKIPAHLRERIPLLIAPDGTIMAVGGYAISEPFRVRPTDDIVLAFYAD